MAISETLSEKPAIKTTSKLRIQSVDILRGIVVVLMAIDHVRVYSGLPPGGPEPGIFFTRWITHFCAPAFVFFAGTSAFLYGNKIKDTARLSKYLVTRGLLLVVLELTLIRFCWTFNVDYSQFVLAGVIWMIGWCMVLLAVLVRLKPSTVGIVGVAIILFQQLFALVPNFLPSSAVNFFGLFWEFIYPSRLNAAFGMTVLYVIVPWIGVMAAGYAFGQILVMEPMKRNKLCLRIGLTAIVLWIIIGSALIVSTPTDDGPPFLFRLLSQAKYPASQLFLLMTLGPTIALVPWAEKMKGKVADIFTAFGRVPFFYYLLHIPLIHLTAIGVNLLREGTTNQEWYASAPYVSMPQEHQWSLGLLYLVFVIDVTILYLLCQWYSRYKSEHPENKLLKYI